MIIYLLVAISSFSWALDCSFRSQAELGALALAKVQGLNCPANKRVHLTFDDGPHAQHTPKLIEELNLRRVKATFFVSTTNISPDKASNRALVSKILTDGHGLGSHGHRHDAYDIRMNAHGEHLGPELSARQQEDEIKLSTRYLNEATGNRYSKQKPLLYRFPYGRGVAPSELELDEMERRKLMHFSAKDRATRIKEYRKNSPALHAVAEEGYGHLLWNHDSEDSTVKAPGNSIESKAEFVAKNLRDFCSGTPQDVVSLFHDIKGFNPEVVAAVIDLGQCLGISFVDQKTILTSQKLKDVGTYITQQAITGAALEDLRTIQEWVKAPTPSCQTTKEPAPGSCYSDSLGRYFQDCEAGEVSICIRGEWFKKTPEKLDECRARGL